MIAAALIAASVLAPAGVTAGIQAGPVCLPVTAQPGHSYPLAVTVDNLGDGTESMTLAVTPAHGGPERSLHQVPPSWVTFAASPVPVYPRSATRVTLTLAIPPGAAPGAYWSDIEAAASAQPGAGAQAALAAAATTAIMLTVGPSATPPPPCDALDLAQSTGRFPPWPSRAFATTGWAQVFARDKGGPVTPDGGPTASAQASPPVVRITASPAAWKVPKNVPSDWPGWLAIIVAGCFFLRWLLRLLGIVR